MLVEMVFLTVSPALTLAMSGGRGARSGRIRETALETYFFISSNILNRKTRLKAT
jgi:hypothetical protein